MAHITNFKVTLYNVPTAERANQAHLYRSGALCLNTAVASGATRSVLCEISYKPQPDQLPAY
jgi:hypothetical protein